MTPDERRLALTKLCALIGEVLNDEDRRVAAELKVLRPRGADGRWARCAARRTVVSTPGDLH